MFSISKLVADAAGNVVALDWSFETEVGRLSNRLELQRPFGGVPLNSVTTAVAVGWLEAQLSNTAEELTACIEQDAQRQAYVSELAEYTVGDTAPVRVAEPVAEELEVQDVADAVWTEAVVTAYEASLEGNLTK